MTDYHGALWSPNNNFFPNTGKKSFLILHGTAGGSSAQGIADFFKRTENTNAPVSSHYIVDQIGTIIQTVLEKDGAYGNGEVHNPNWSGNPNYYTISIEHVKPDDQNATPLTPAQQAASFALIKDICQRNGIGMHDADDTTGITGHFAIDPVNRARCPGNYPWSELWAFLKGNSSMASQVPTGWKDDGTILTAPNKIPVRGGFRTWVLEHNWDPTNWPLEPEYQDDPVERSHPTLGAGAAQVFRWKRLCFAMSLGIYESWLGQELKWYQMQPSRVSPTIQGDIDSVITAANKLRADLV